MAQARKVGFVDRLVRERAFGFIKDGEGNEHFLHRANCNPNALFDDLQEHDHVTFTPTPSPKGSKAMSVERATDADSATLGGQLENMGNR